MCEETVGKNRFAFKSGIYSGKKKIWINYQEWHTSESTLCKRIKESNGMGEFVAEV